jgi:hypothetical protein
MSQLLDHFRIKAFWSFCDTFPDDFELVVRYLQTEMDDLGGPPGVRFKVDELRTIFERVHAADKERVHAADKPQILAARSNQSLYPFPTGVGDPLEIRAIAPTHQMARDYVRSLLRFLQERARNNVSVRSFQHHHHNSVSIALVVSYGQTRIILGGDVERVGWHAVLTEFTPEFLSANVVKVSHHGSATGYCQDLWPMFGGRKRTLAILTPYFRHHLPEPLALDEISGHARVVYSACGRGHRQLVLDWQSRRSSSKRPESFQAKAQAKLEGIRTARSTRVEDYAREAARKFTQPRHQEAEVFGHCEVRAFPDGRCQVLTHGDAMVLAESD